MKTYSKDIGRPVTVKLSDSYMPIRINRNSKTKGTEEHKESLHGNVNLSHESEEFERIPMKKIPNSNMPRIENNAHITKVSQKERRTKSVFNSF